MMGYLILSNILSSLAAKIILIKKFWISWLTEPWPTGWMQIFLSLKYFLIPQAMKYYFLGPMRGRTQTTHVTQSTLLVPVASSTFSPSTWITFSILTWERRTTQLKYIISMERGRTRGWSTVRCRYWESLVRSLSWRSQPWSYATNLYYRSGILLNLHCNAGKTIENHKVTAQEMIFPTKSELSSEIFRPFEK